MEKQPSQIERYKTNPLYGELHEFQPDGKILSKNVALSVDQYAENPIGGIERLPEELPIYIIRNLGGTAIETALFRSPSNQDGELKAITLGWGGNFYTDLARLELAEIAAQNPHSDLLVINNPGAGRSSPIDRVSMKYMKKTGSFAPYGEEVARAINEFTYDYNHINLYGHSMGARTAVATAPYVDKSIDYVTATDPPGSENLGLLGIANAFMIQEGRHAKEYAAKSDNQTSLELQQANDKNALNSLRAMGGSAVKQMFLDQTQAMSKAGLEGDLKNLTKSGNVDILQINSPEFSAISNPETVRAILQQLAKEFPQFIIRQLLLLGQTHSVNVGGNSHTTGMLSKLAK